MVLSYGMMDVYMKALLKRIKDMGKVHYSGQMETYTLVNGNKGNNMAMANKKQNILNFKMVFGTMVKFSK